MTQTAASIIELKGITKRFPGVVALDDVSFSIYPGEVHAVLGENGAGKSTLMNILAGDLQPDSGEIVYKGRVQNIPNPMAAQRMGISVVYQELALCSNLSIAQNISLSAAANQSALSLVKRREFDQHAREVLARLGLASVNPRQVVGKLSVAQQQMVEIAKAISLNADVLILDEPNSALTIEETERLFTVLRQLQDDGVTIIYVSHRLEEVVRIADRITVMRDGRHVDTTPNDASVTVDSLITKMVGRALDHFTRHHSAAPTSAKPQVLLEIEHMHSGSAVGDVSFAAGRGEIVGVAGLPDSGKDELVDCIFGLRPYTGTITVDGQSVQINSPVTAIKHGFALVPADRRGSGAMLVMSVENNTIAASLKEVSKSGLLRRGGIRRITQKYVDELDIRISSPRQKMRTLSGGNQQKVILGRGLATNPSILLLHEPTRGIDVGAKAEIYDILQALAREGVTILIVSSELPELISQCDRILVMHQGKITGEFSGDQAQEELILACAMGQMVHLNPVQS
jgi:ribose transport system ATP-binding protein